MFELSKIIQSNQELGSIEHRERRFGLAKRKARWLRIKALTLGSPTAEKSQVMFDEWRKRISNQPRPLKKRSSFSEAEGSGGPNMQRFYYQQLYQKSDPLFRFDPRNVPAEEEEEHSSQSSDSDPRNSTSTGRSNPIDIQPPPPKSPPKGPVTSLTKKFEQFVTDDPSDDYDGPPIPPPLQPPISVQDIVTKVTPKLRSKKVKGILKPQGAPRNNERRVQFDPLALLLDASLEGELDLVKKVIDKVQFLAILQSGFNDF